MTDWTVKVKTRSGYIKDVVVYDYCYPMDAVDAAMAQTDAVDYISVQHIPVKEATYTPSQPVYMNNSQPQTYIGSNSGPDFNLFEAITFFIGALLIPICLFLPGFWYGGFMLMGIAFIHFLIRAIKDQLF
jgi:hypothetical protein